MHQPRRSIALGLAALSGLTVVGAALAGGDSIAPDSSGAIPPASCVEGGAALRAEIHRVHEAQRNVGLAVGIRRGDAVIYLEDLGFADLEFEAPVDPSTQFGIASVTKAFTGTLVLRLLEGGRIDLDDIAALYVDLDEGRTEARAPGDLRAPWLNTVTIRQLLTHLSGLPHPSDRTPELFATRYESAMHALDAVADVDLQSTPGEAYSYSSANYNVLAAIVEAVTGDAFRDVMRDSIIVPLGLSSTGFDDVLAVRPGRARRYSFFHPWTYAEADTLYRVPTWDYSFNPGGGNMYSTVEDLLEFGGALLEPGFFPEDTWSRLYEPITEGSRWSYGWFVGSDAPMGSRLYMSGSNPGLQAALAVFRDHGLVVVALSNTWGKNARSGDLIDVGRFAQLCLGIVDG